MFTKNESSATLIKGFEFVLLGYSTVWCVFPNLGNMEYAHLILCSDERYEVLFFQVLYF